MTPWRLQSSVFAYRCRPRVTQNRSASGHNQRSTCAFEGLRQEKRAKAIHIHPSA